MAEDTKTVAELAAETKASSKTSSTKTKAAAEELKGKLDASR
jgi:hypothetical protein